MIKPYPLIGLRILKEKIQKLKEITNPSDEEKDELFELLTELEEAGYTDETNSI